MKTLLVASQGGHLSEMMGLADRIENLGEHRWVTNPHRQTEAALAGEDVQYVPHIDSRDIVALAREIPKARRLLRACKVERVVSTGSALALAYLPVAAAMGIPAHYIESSTRINAPSMTGRLLAQLPGVTTWWQHPRPPAGWSRLDGLYAHFTTERQTISEITSIVVTVGTTGYCFRRLIERLVAIIPPDVNVLWQVGDSNTDGLAIDGRRFVDSAELDRAIRSADVVISHAGAGSLLQCLLAGKVPVYVPRLLTHNEQLDDHQVELANWARSAGLAITVDASEVSADDLIRAAGMRAISNPKTSIHLEPS